MESTHTGANSRNVRPGGAISPCSYPVVYRQLWRFLECAHQHPADGAFEAAGHDGNPYPQPQLPTPLGCYQCPTLQYPSVTARARQSPLIGDEDRSVGISRSWPPPVDLGISLAILLSVFAAYSSVVHFDFVAFDDWRYVGSRICICSDGFTARNFHWIFFSFSPDNWFPLTRLSLILDYQVFSLNAAWYHAENVAIHAVASLLLFGFLRRATGVRWPCAFVAFVFALHPLHVESVAWVSERKDVLCALFWFATLWAWLRYTGKPTIGRYVAALILFSLGLAAKPMIVTLPVLLFLLDVWPLRSTLSLKVMLRRLPEKIPFAALSAGVMWITMQAQHESLTSVGPPLLRAENALMSIAVYIGDTIWPARLWAVYAYPVSLPLWQSILVALGLVAICAVVVRQLSTRPYLAAGWFWFLVTLVPVIGIVQVGGQARADRYMYVPMVGLSIMVAWGVADLVGSLAFDAARVAASCRGSWGSCLSGDGSRNLVPDAILEKHGRPIPACHRHGCGQLSGLGLSGPGRHGKRTVPVGSNVMLPGGAENPPRFRGHA